MFWKTGGKEASVASPRLMCVCEGPSRQLPFAKSLSCGNFTEILTRRTKF
jgi:hypothetical protein